MENANVRVERLNEEDLFFCVLHWEEFKSTLGPNDEYVALIGFGIKDNGPCKVCASGDT